MIPHLIVITWVPEELPDGTMPDGNMAAAFDVFEHMEEPNKENNYEGRVKRLPFEMIINLRVPVFTLGEVIFADDDGREVFYPGRKPSKWLVEYEEFYNAEEALARSEEVIKARDDKAAAAHS